MKWIIGGLIYLLLLSVIMISLSSAHKEEEDHE
jgi:hypothetical protein